MEQNESEGEVREETEVRRKDYHNESLPPVDEWEAGTTR